MDPTPIDISKLDKAEVLAALYNNSKQQGMGFLHARGRTDMTKEEAAELLKETTDFDYLHGRVMKISLDGNTLNPWLYDRDNGQGAAARAIASLAAETLTDSDPDYAIIAERARTALNNSKD